MVEGEDLSPPHPSHARPLLGNNSPMYMVGIGEEKTCMRHPMSNLHAALGHSWAEYLRLWAVDHTTPRPHPSHARPLL